MAAGLLKRCIPVFIMLTFLFFILAYGINKSDTAHVVVPYVISGDNYTAYVYEFKAEGYRGKNLVNFSFEPGMDAKTFMALVPEADVISYYDPIREKSVGYVRVFGGIGTNFYLHAGITYEVYVRKTTNLTLIR